ncbi:hypothetical protein HMPREF9419_0315 [Prevotella nigrescens ATCC 33563]|nr:hypothetical protein HMPREF9419_0315 [Prevotella nigrescens ATCC 33563]
MGRTYLLIPYVVYYYFFIIFKNDANLRKNHLKAVSLHNN